MPMRRAHYYRKKAEECRLHAAAAKHAEVEETLQRLAAQWERLARELMRLANRRPANRLNNLRPKSGHNRERLGRSPGKGDAVVMCWSEGNQAAMSRHNAWKWETPRQRWIV
jgi:hypothetical protein